MTLFTILCIVKSIFHFLFSLQYLWKTSLSYFLFMLEIFLTIVCQNLLASAPPPFVLLFSMAFSVYVLLGHVFVFRNLAKYCWISSITSSVHLFLLLFGLRSFFFNTINIILIIIINVDWIQIFDIIIEVELKIQGLHCFACTSNYPPKFFLTRPLQYEFIDVKLNF